MSDGHETPIAKRLEWDGRITPTFILGIGQILAVAFVGGIIWNSVIRDNQENAKGLGEHANAIMENRAEIKLLRAQDTTIAVLQNDVAYIKQSLQRIEAVVAKERRTELQP